MSTRRDFLLATGAVAAGGAVSAAQDKTDTVTADGLMHAERLAGVQFTDAEREQMLGTIDEHLERLRARQAHGMPDLDLAPALTFDPRQPGMDFGHLASRLRLPERDPGPLPQDDEDIAYASVADLGRWIGDGALSSERLTRIYLDRLERFGPKLECVITLMKEPALARAKAMDAELAAGRRRGPLHGIPWGAKDLLDTAGIRTTFGAAPYKERVAERDAFVVQRLEAAGAVLVAKLTLGALAYNDIWFGGKTRNPWKLEQGSSGSSAGSCAATAAGLVAFALGTETYGSIVSPCMRCGVTGLRPTFGRVARTGAMPLCWSLDKIGPITRTVSDAAIVLRAIAGADATDPASVDMPLPLDLAGGVRGLRVGYAPAWFEEAGDNDRAALDAARAAGVELVEIELPEWPYGTLLNVLMAEAAAAFETLTRSGKDDELVWQEPQSWPNGFRQTWFIPAIEYVQADRFRRQVCAMMAERFDDVEVILSPSYAGSLLLITNFTGHPCLTIRTGFRDDDTPRGTTVWGRLYEEGTVCRLGLAIEERLGVATRRPVL